MPGASSETQKKPNILLIMGDDIGWYNISAYNHGVMGYRTPNIDRLAKEGTMFTDWYGRPRCFHHWPVPDPHRSYKSRASRSGSRAAPGRSHYSRVVKTAGLRDRA